MRNLSMKKFGTPIGAAPGVGEREGRVVERRAPSMLRRRAGGVGVGCGLALLGRPAPCAVRDSVLTPRRFPCPVGASVGLVGLTSLPSAGGRVRRRGRCCGVPVVGRGRRRSARSAVGVAVGRRRCGRRRRGRASAGPRSSIAATGVGSRRSCDAGRPACRAATSTVRVICWPVTRVTLHVVQLRCGSRR